MRLFGKSLFSFFMVLPLGFQGASAMEGFTLVSLMRKDFVELNSVWKGNLSKAKQKKETMKKQIRDLKAQIKGLKIATEKLANRNISLDEEWYVVFYKAKNYSERSKDLSKYEYLLASDSEEFEKLSVELNEYKSRSKRLEKRIKNKDAIIKKQKNQSRRGRCLLKNQGVTINMWRKDLNSIIKVLKKLEKDRCADKKGIETTKLAATLRRIAVKVCKVGWLEELCKSKFSKKFSED